MSTTLLRNNKVNYLTSDTSALVYANDKLSYVNFDFLIYNGSTTQTNFDQYYIIATDITTSQINCLTIYPKRYVDKLIYSVRPFVFVSDITNISEGDTYKFHVDVFDDANNAILGSGVIDTFKLNPQNINSNCVTRVITVQTYISKMCFHIIRDNHKISTKTLYKINNNAVEIGEIIVM